MINKVTLPNGLRIVTEPMEHVRSVSVGVWVGAGSRWERAGECGASHFLEHLLFKGTQQRSARQLAEAIDSVGGHMNAFTTKECTCLYVKVLDQHLPLALELLSDMVLNSRFDAGELEKEKSVILEEIKLYEDTPDELVHDLFDRCLWSSHPLGRSIIGSEREVSALTRSHIQSFYQRFYHPANTVIAVAGCVDNNALVKQVEQLFGDWAPSPSSCDVQPAAVGGQEHYVHVKDTEQVHFCIGTVGRALEHDDLYPLLAFGNLLGGGASSRLFQEIREERGLAYSVHVFQAAYRDTGVFGVYAGSSPATAAQVLDLIMEEFTKIRRFGIRETELSWTKAQLSSSIMMSLESTSARMTHLGKNELLLGRWHSPDEVLQRIEAINRLDVMRVGEAVLDADRLALAAVAPNSSPFEKFQ